MPKHGRQQGLMPLLVVDWTKEARINMEKELRRPEGYRDFPKVNILYHTFTYLSSRIFN